MTNDPAGFLPGLINLMGDVTANRIHEAARDRGLQIGLEDLDWLARYVRREAIRAGCDYTNSHEMEFAA